MSTLGLTALVTMATVGLSLGPSDTSNNVNMPPANAKSVSIGHPYYGKLVGGVQLPVEGPYHTIQRSTRARRWTWATPYLVRSLMVAARDVGLAHAGEPFVVGNLSKKGGGDIKMSRSHNTGRDVDYAYWTETLQGESAPSAYHRFGDNGRSLDAPGRYRLDLARNWAFVRAMLNSPEAELQYLITSPGIEKQLLRHAQAIGEPAYLIHRAERMMMLPSWAKPHDNHVHLRVLCSPEDWHAGCRNGGPVWPWAVKMYGALEAERKKLGPALHSDDPKARIAAMKVVASRRVDTAVMDVAESLAHEQASVRRAALNTIKAITTEANAHTVLKVARLLNIQIAKRLIAHALPLAGAQGLDTARAICDRSHPAVSERRDADLERKAQRILSQYDWISAILPGGP